MKDLRIRSIMVLQLAAIFHCLLCPAFGQDESKAKKQQPQIEATRGVKLKDATYSSIRDVYSFDLSSIGGTKLKVMTSSDFLYRGL